jgi:drug/metabolite transporter (DMT)-like permease
MTYAEYFKARLPLFYVFLSGVGFSFQTLIIKVLAENGFHASFQCIFFRGFIQFLLACWFVYYDEDRLAGKGPKLFGDSSWIKLMLFLRSFVGFGGIAFSFLAVELIPMGDATVLIMLSPLLTAILSYFILGEPWRLPELVATIISLVGVVMVSKPPFIFGGSTTETTDFYTGVIYGLVSAVSAAFAYLFVRILGTTAKMPWSNVCFSQSIGQMVLSIPCLYIFGQTLRFDLTAFQYFMLILGGSIGAVSQILMTMGMQREKSAAATGMRMSDVAFGYLWQVLFTADALSLLSLGGAVLVTCSIFIIILCKEEAPAAPGATSDGAGVSKEVELAQLHSTHSALHGHHHSHLHNYEYDLQRSYDLEDGFEDSSIEGDVTCDLDDSEGSANSRFDFAKLRAKLAEEGDDWEDVKYDQLAAAQEGEIDMSLHGEHGGLLNAQVRSEADSGKNAGFLSKVVTKSPLFGAAVDGKRGQQYSTLAQGESI